MDNYMFGYLPNVYYEQPCMYYPNFSEPPPYYPTQVTTSTPSEPSLEDLCKQMTAQISANMEGLRQQMAEQTQRMIEEFQQKMEAEYQRSQAESQKLWALIDQVTANSAAMLTPQPLEEHKDSQMVIPENTFDDNFDDNVSVDDEFSVESPDPNACYCDGTALCVECFTGLYFSGKIENADRFAGLFCSGNLDQEDQEDVCSPVPEDKEEPLGVDDSSKTIECVESRGVDDELIAEFPDIVDFSDSFSCNICTNSNPCVVCAEISACIAGENFVSAVDEDIAEVEATPVTFSNCLPPSPEEPVMEFKPLDFAPWPVQEVEPHFYWGDFIEKEVSCDPRGSEKSAALGEVIIVIKCSPPHQSCKLGDHGTNFSPLATTWDLCYKQWDPGGTAL